MFNFLRDCQTVFQIFQIYMCFPKCIPISSVLGFQFLHFLTNTCDCLFYYSRSNGCQVIPNYVFDLHFPSD